MMPPTPETELYLATIEYLEVVRRLLPHQEPDVQHTSLGSINLSVVLTDQLQKHIGPSQHFTSSTN